MDSEVKELVQFHVTAGFLDVDEIVDDVCEVYETYDDDFQKSVFDHANKLIQNHLNMQKSWNYDTDCDKLDEAFSELDRNGIVARQNFWCCQTCGHSYIKHEMSDSSQHHPIQGYVFFHAQDTESAVKQNYLYLAFGSPLDNEQDSVDVANHIVETLTRHGLDVSWNESVRNRILIKKINWQRRRYTEGF